MAALSSGPSTFGRAASRRASSASASRRATSALSQLGLEPPSNEAVVRVDGEIAPLGSARLVTVPLDLSPPLRQGGVAVVLERLCRSERGLDAGRGDGREERCLNGLVDLDPADRQMRHASPRDELPAGAVIAGARVRALVVHGEAPPAVPAGSDPLQECRALPERTAWLVGLWADVGTDAGLVGLEGCPVDVAGVVVHDQDLPTRLARRDAFGHGQHPSASTTRSCRVRP